MFGYYGCKQRLYCCIGNDEQQKELEDYRHRVDEQKKLLQDYKQLLGKMENELKRLQKAIDDFNKSRRFYERKIKNV